MQKILKSKEEIVRGQKIIRDFVEALSNITIGDSFSEVVSLIKDNKGLVITTGMGKAGIIMKKFSATLCSLGIRSCYIHPGDALHGDLGIIGKSDILFIASTSGKTREVLDLLELSKTLNVKNTVGLTSHKDSPLRDSVKYLLDMGIIEEAGDLKLSPTTSTLVMMAITDALALVVSEKMNFTKEKFSKYHHNGYCGSMARNDNKIY